MTTDIPLPLALTLLAALESVVATYTIPQSLPPNPLTWLLIRLTSLHLGLWVIYAVFIYPFFVSPLRNLPGPKNGNIILGQGRALFSRPAGKPFLDMVKTIPNEGLIHFRGFFNQDRLLLTDPGSLSEVLVSKTYEFTKPSGARNFLRIVLGDGLIIVEGEEHKFQRKHIMPVFGFRHIKELYPIFWSKAISLTHGIVAEIQDKPMYSVGEKSKLTGEVNIGHWANKVTMDIIGLAGLGREFNALKNSEDELVKNYEEILEPTKEKAIYFAVNVLFGTKIVKMLPWKINERMKITTTTLREICRQFVRDQRQLIKAQGTDHLDILSILIKSNNFSDDQLVDQLLTFLAAGHETTSSAFTWTTYLLAANPEYQTRLRAEVQRHVPSPWSKDSGDLSSILESLPLLNAVCNEVLRLYPTVPVTVRVSDHTTTIQGTTVPPYTQIILAPWAVNRSPHLWGDNSEDFVPERWIDYDAASGMRPEDGRPNNHGGAGSNYSILTFLHGPRSCIGQGFAKAELRAILAAFIGAFEWTLAKPDDPVEPAGVITTKTKDPLILRLTQLDPW